MSKSLMKKLQKKILEQYKDLTEFSYKSGVPYGTISKENKDPSLPTFIAICRHLKFNINDLNELLGIKLIEENITNELKAENEKVKKENEKLKKEVEDLKNKNLKLYEEITEINRDMRKYHTDYYEKKTH